MPVQSDSLLNTVKQGTQLFRESGEAVSGLSEKAGLPKAPSTPLETAVIGGTPSQSKMAGTPASLKGQATKIKMPTSLLLATQQRREQIDPTLTQAQEQAIQLSQKLQGLGSLGQRVPGLIAKGVQQAFDGKSVAPTIDESQLANVPPDQRAAVTAAIGTLQQVWNPQDPSLAGKTDKEKADAEAAFKQSQMTAAALISNATGKSPQDLAGANLGGLLKTTEASMDAAIDAGTLNQINLGDLQGGAAALGYTNWAELATDLGIEIPAGKTADEVMQGLTVKELGEAVDSVRRRGFQTQQDWLAVLQDPTSSPSDRSIARKILQQMGASGVREAEASVAQLSEQVQASNQVTVNLTGTPQSIQIQDLLTSPDLKAAVSILLDPNNAAYAAVKAANPELFNWVEANKTQLQNVVKDVTQDAKDLAALNAANSQVLALPNLDQKTQDAIGKALYGNDWGKVTGQKFDLTKAPLLKDWGKLPTSEQPHVANALSAIADGGTSADLSAFLGTTRDNLIRLGLNTQAGVDQFKAYWSEMKLIRSIDVSTPSESALFDLTGVTSDQLKVMNKEKSALNSLGISTNTSLPVNLQDALELRKFKPTSISSLLSAGSLPTTIKRSIDTYSSKVSELATTGGDVTKALTAAVLQADGLPSKDQLRGVANQVTSGKTPEDAIKNLETLELKTGTQFTDLKTQFASDQINQVAASLGLETFNSALSTVKSSPEGALALLQKYRDMEKKLPVGGPVYTLYRKKLAELDSAVAASLSSKGQGPVQVGSAESAGPSFTATGYWG